MILQQPERISLAKTCIFMDLLYIVIIVVTKCAVKLWLAKNWLIRRQSLLTLLQELSAKQITNSGLIKKRWQQFPILVD